MRAAILLTAGLLSTVALAEPKAEETKPGKDWYVTIDKIPESVDEFIELRDKIATTPQGGIVAFLVAGIMLGDDADESKGALEGRRIGEQAMIAAVDASNLGEVIKARQSYKRTDYKGYMLASKMSGYLLSMGFRKNRPYTGRSYVIGTKPEDGYKLPPPPYKFLVTAHNVQGKDANAWKGMSPSSGAEGFKPYEVKKNDKGIWKVDNPSSFFAGCKPPPEAKAADGL